MKEENKFITTRNFRTSFNNWILFTSMYKIIQKNELVIFYNK